MSYLVATRCDGINTSGTKRPMYMECREPNGSHSNWLLKVARTGMINERHLAAEIVSATLLEALGLQVADHLVAVIDAPFLPDINRTLASLGPGLELTPGCGVAARSTLGIQSLAVGVTYSKDHRADASILYGFDLMATHYDRLPANPNCGVLGGHLFVYDFDQCFPHVSEPSSLYASREPWQVAAVDWRDLHVFRPWLKKDGIDREAVHGAFSNWTESWWTLNRPNIPPEWENVADDIWERASQIFPNLDQFIEQLELSLI